MFNATRLPILDKMFLDCCKRNSIASLLRFLIVAGCLGLMTISQAAAQSSNDGFEASTIGHFWVVGQQNGTASLTNSQSHSGLQSLSLASASGGQRYIDLKHYYDGIKKGKVSVWMYDSAPGQQTLYANLILVNSKLIRNYQVGSGFWIGVQDFDSGWYNYGDGVATTRSSIPRSTGWHKFEIDIRTGITELRIDSSLVATFTGDHGFDEIQLQVSGPSSRPNATYYFDDFIVDLVDTPQPSLEITLFGSWYNGETISISEFRFKNPGLAARTIEAKVWIKLPDGSLITILNLGADGSLSLPAGFDQNFGPFSLFTVTSSHQRGTYRMTSRIVDPISGNTLSEDVNVFDIY